MDRETTLAWADKETNRSIFLRLLAPRAGERIVDVGAGNGKIAALVASKGCEVHAIEPNQKRLDQLRRELPAVESKLASSEKIPYPDGYFDKVYSTLALHHFSDRSQSVREFARILKPQGLLLIAEIRPSSARGRLLRFLENGILRADLKFLEMGTLGELVAEGGLFEETDRQIGSSIYFVSCVRAAAP